MGARNAAIVRRLYGAWNRDDWEGARPILHPRIEFRTSGLFPGFEPVYRGPDGVREFWETMRDAWERFTIEVERVYEERDTVVAAVWFRARGRESGVPVELEFAHVWRFADGQVVWYAAYPSLAEALEVAGISAPSPSQPPGR